MKNEKILVQLKGDYKLIARRLPHRSLPAIRSQCQKLGLRKTRHLWTGAEISRLRKLYPDQSREDICAAFPHSHWGAICQAARYHGIRRRKREFKLLGIAALDDVRRRCYEINWSMSDLDKAAKTKTYFAKAGWHCQKSINHKALGRAIEALDGTVQAEWNSEV